MKFSAPAPIPAGKVAAPKSIIPHLALANVFQRLANMHRNLAGANAPDPANARVPRPDKAALDAQSGAPLIREPVIGGPPPL